MALELADEKQHAYELIDRLAPGQLAAVVGLLEVMLDPVSRTIATAPIEDEEITAETAAELDAARASLGRGEGVSHEKIRHEFGLTPH